MSVNDSYTLVAEAQQQIMGLCNLLTNIPDGSLSFVSSSELFHLLKPAESQLSLALKEMDDNN